MVNISNQPPRGIFEKCQKKWGISFDNVIFAVGDTIHTKNPIGEDLLTHEKVHLRQQSQYVGGWQSWWDRYLIDDKFRLEQEIEAYTAQYNYVKTTIKDRNKLNKYLVINIVKPLSGTMYGNMISERDAIMIIKIIFI